MGRRAVAIGLVAVTASSCSTQTEGQPSTTSPASPTTAPGTATAEVSLERPRTFELADVDPCELLSPTQLVQIGVDEPATPSGQAGSDPTCNFVSTTGASYGVFLELTANATDTISAAQGKVAETIVIDGFDVPLISVQNQGCSAFVNTGDFEYLSVQANGTGVIPDDELCQLVQPATQMVLENLTALQP